MTEASSDIQPIVSLKHVEKIFEMGENKVHALDNVSFDIAPAAFVSIVGPSGSGKSTCMNMIGALDRPTSGTVLIDGIATEDMSEKELAALRNETIGFVFQQYHLLPHLSILENVMLPLRYQRVPYGERKERAAEVLQAIGLGDRLTHTPNELSGGQKQRTAIARALVTRPKLILADEPTGALDSETGHSVLDLFLTINREGTAVIIVTHDSDIAAQARRTIRLKDGRVVDGGTDNHVHEGSDHD